MGKQRSERRRQEREKETEREKREGERERGWERKREKETGGDRSGTFRRWYAQGEERNKTEYGGEQRRKGKGRIDKASQPNKEKAIHKANESPKQSGRKTKIKIERPRKGRRALQHPLPHPLSSVLTLYMNTRQGRCATLFIL